MAWESIDFFNQASNALGSGMNVADKRFIEKQELSDNLLVRDIGTNPNKYSNGMFPDNMSIESYVNHSLSNGFLTGDTNSLLKSKNDIFSTLGRYEDSFIGKQPDRIRMKLREDFNGLRDRTNKLYDQYSINLQAGLTNLKQSDEDKLTISAVGKNANEFNKVLSGFKDNPVRTVKLINSYVDNVGLQLTQALSKDDVSKIKQNVEKANIPDDIKSKLLNNIRIRETQIEIDGSKEASLDARNFTSNWASGKFGDVASKFSLLKNGGGMFKTDGGIELQNIHGYNGVFNKAIINDNYNRLKSKPFKTEQENGLLYIMGDILSDRVTASDIESSLNGEGFRPRKFVNQVAEGIRNNPEYSVKFGDSYKFDLDKFLNTVSGKSVVYSGGAFPNFLNPKSVYTVLVASTQKKLGVEGDDLALTIMDDLYRKNPNGFSFDIADVNRIIKNYVRDNNDGSVYISFKNSNNDESFMTFGSDQQLRDEITNINKYIGLEMGKEPFLNYSMIRNGDNDELVRMVALSNIVRASNLKNDKAREYYVDMYNKIIRAKLDGSSIWLERDKNGMIDINLNMVDLFGNMGTLNKKMKYEDVSNGKK